MALLRTPRARFSAIKYLEKRIPRDLNLARDAAQRGHIHVGKYVLKIDTKKVLLESDAIRREEELARISDMTMESYFYFYYPNKHNLVLNALIAGIEDNQIFVIRGVLDFLLTHMPITSDINSLDEKVNLVEAVLIKA